MDSGDDEGGGGLLTGVSRIFSGQPDGVAHKVFQVNQPVALVILFVRSGAQVEFEPDQFGRAPFGIDVPEGDHRSTTAAPLETVTKRGTANLSMTTNNGSLGLKS